jgi:hypothetical protein
MVMTSEQFPSFVDFDPVLTDIFFSQYERDLGGGGVSSVFAQLMSTKAKETDQRVGGFSDPVPFNGRVEYDDVERGYAIEYTFPELAKGFQITRKMRDDLQYQTIFDSASGMATAFARKRRKDAASVFNNAFSGSYLGYDSKALCANDHPRSRTDSTAVDNLLTLALSAANLETAVVAMQSFGDDLGEEIVIMPDTIIVPRALRKTALEIVGSEYQPDSANNAINVQAGIWRVVVDPYLTDSNAWFIVDSTLANRFLKWYDRVTPEFAGTQDFDTMIWKYRGYMRYGYGWSDWRWVLGSNPS